MVLEPSILLLDEATSALDEENQAVVMNAIEELTHPLLGWAKGSEKMSTWLIESGFEQQRPALMTLSGRELVDKLEEREHSGEMGAAIACGGRIITAQVCDELADAVRRAQHTTLVIAHRLSTLQKWCVFILLLRLPLLRARLVEALGYPLELPRASSWCINMAWRMAY